MALDRRSLLKGIASAGVAVVGGAAGGAAASEAPRKAPPDAVGMLYDATRCIGCKTCVVACHEANFDNPYQEEEAAGQLYFDPDDLDARTRNIIKLFKDGDRTAYVKRQCMHCIDPACAGACMLGSLQKRQFGVVSYDPSRCVGCRYCQMACPFNIPKFEWTKPTSHRIVKCELCDHRLAEGKIPACCEVCPTSAVVYGRYVDLLEEAHRRIQENPERYRDHVYGEHEAGGTQVLYLGPPDVEFTELGLPALSEDSVAARSRTIQHGIYQGFVAPAALYAVLGVAVWRNKRRNEQLTHDEAGGEEAS